MTKRQLLLLICVGVLMVMGAIQNARSELTNAPKTRVDLPTDGVFRFGEHEAYLMMPPDYRKDRKYPLIVHFAGRGMTDVATGSNLGSAEFSLFRQKALARGYIMVTPAYGSDCWMNAAAEALVLECLEYLGARLSIDNNRICILGCSMGGGGALVFAGRHADKVAAVCDLFGVSDVERLWRSGSYHASLAAAFGGGPDEKPDVYRARSGISYIAALKSMPLLVIHGDKDSAVPLDYSQTLVDKLKAAGGQPKFIIVPGKGHSDGIIQGLEDTVLDHFDAAINKQRP